MFSVNQVAKYQMALLLWKWPFPTALWASGKCVVANLCELGTAQSGNGVCSATLAVTSVLWPMSWSSQEKVNPKTP